ncbi:MAG: cytochrome c oxidase subunit II [Sphingomonas adhaesiva]|uniref:cytochrome c oxidase subunit II n=1 Tax=Sphingomonas adhaesiva TaxID=28212 RepID=UPI002FF73AF7
MSTIDPAGPYARSVTGLWWVMLGGAALLSLLVFVLLALAFRRRPDGDGVANPRLWIGWLGLAMPGAVLLPLLGYALVIGARTLPVPAEDAVAIDVVARRYAWDFGYPGGRRTRDVLHIPAGRPVDLEITATDVIHSLWVPRLAGKMDAIPGQTNRLRIEADAPGTYQGECAEYCGTGHGNHGFVVVAHDAAGWAAFIGERAR